MDLVATKLWALTSFQARKVVAGGHLRYLGEEAITDVGLTYAEAQSKGRFHFVLWDKVLDEPVHGADFEWWVISADYANALRFMVQAKRSSAEDDYPGLDKRSTLGKRQIELLIEACSPGQAYATYDPLYFFYNAERVKTGKAWPSDRCANPARTDAALRGITVAHATDILDALDNHGTNIDVIAPAALPWGCVMCCPNGTALQDVARRLSAGGPSASPQEPAPSNTWPWYVRVALAGDGGRDLAEQEAPAGGALLVTVLNA